LKRTLCIAALAVIGHASAALAQSSVYVGGAAFLDLQRGSGETSPDPNKRDATLGGGGVRVGGFLASRWSLELGVDASASSDTTIPVFPSSTPSIFVSGIDLLPSVTLVVDERIHTRVTATSIVLGYHPPAHGRFRPGFKAGLSFLRSSNTITSTISYKVGDPRFLPALTLPAPTTTTSSSITFNTAATVAAELGISLTPHASLVPEMRAFGVDNRIFLRPGAGLRWFF
jgi:hypothetical protein